MEWTGEEKRIQASFHELRLADERLLPPFASVWNRAQSGTMDRRPALDFRFAAALLVVCLLFFSFTLAAKHWPRSQRSNYMVANGAIKPGTSPPQIKGSEGSVKLAENGRSGPVGRKLRPMGLAAGRQMAKRESATRTAMAISRWQSPTATLLRSPADELLKSLPHLNQTVNGLEITLTEPF